MRRFLRIWTPISEAFLVSTLPFVIPPAPACRGTGAYPVCGVSHRRGPEGRWPNVSPAPEGPGINDDDSERRKRGTIRVILRDISHSYSNNCVYAV
ncbi:MAG TPA: hypothetical protein VFE27_20010 [Acidobacteriaceae bacterium]|nr:hypothetical protein [Acidobacteriaceae bacterium]